MNGSDSNNGDQLNPVQTITQAITMADGIQTTIQLIPGQFNENLNVNQSNINFICQDVPYIMNQTILNGTITFSPGINNVGFKNLEINSGSNVCVTYPSSLSSALIGFYKCNFINDSGFDSIQIAQTSGFINLNDCQIAQSISTTGDSSGTIINIGNTDVTVTIGPLNIINDGYAVYLSGCIDI